jgi:GH24 family phage-related lysozyme (muramidase)
MSRTYRRRHACHNLVWVLRDYRWNNGALQRTILDPNSQAGKKALAKYYSDAGFGDYGHATAPHWYRRYLNHRSDRREAQELNRWLKNSEHEVLLPRRVRDASWYW